MFFGIELVKDRKTKEPATAEAQHVVFRYISSLLDTVAKVLISDLLVSVQNKLTHALYPMF